MMHGQKNIKLNLLNLKIRCSSQFSCRSASPAILLCNREFFTVFAKALGYNLARARWIQPTWSHAMIVPPVYS